MATLSKGKTFGSTEQVTAAKLHSLVDDGSISGIVNADITDNTIQDAKIYSVGGGKLVSLANIPSGSGTIPIANIPKSTDGTFADNSDSYVPTQKAVKTYSDTKISKTTVGEIAALTEKTTLHNDDLILIEDSEASNAKKKAKRSNIAPGVADGSITQAKLANYSAGDVLLASADTETAGFSHTDYQKKKEIKIARAGTLRIKFAIKTAGSAEACYGKIYRNGVAVGTERSKSGSDYQTFSEDIAGWSVGDLCQLYCKQVPSASGYPAAAKEFRIYVDDIFTERVTLD